MKLSIKFANGVAPVEYRTNGSNFKPVELVVAKGGQRTRRESLLGYLQTIDYAFSGVGNRADGNIYSLAVAKNWAGGVHKDGENVTWNCAIDKTYVIIYDVSVGSVFEKFYVADSILYDVEKNKVFPVWKKDLFLIGSASRKKNIILAITVFTKYMSDYSLRWLNDRNELALLNKKGDIINIEDVAESDSYILIKLINLLINKDMHLGVFFINCAGFSETVLKAMIAFIKEYYGDTFVFLRNCGKDLKVDRDIFVLPNYVIKEGVMQK